MDPVVLSFLLLMALMPVGAVRSYRKLNAGTPFPPKLRFMALTIVLEIALGAVALWAIHPRERLLLRLPHMTPAVWAWGVLFFAVLTLTIPLRWKRAEEWKRRRLMHMTPQKFGEYPMWVLLSLSAGVSEEIVWRGVLFSLLAGYTHSVMVAALISAVHFGVCHIVQGWKSVVLIAALGLAAQTLVLAADSLIPAMVLHFAYDAVAGIWMGKLGRKSEAGLGETQELRNSET
jgi:membrane protease YdiL (CAAX protease family)